MSHSDVCPTLTFGTLAFGTLAFGTLAFVHSDVWDSYVWGRTLNGCSGTNSWPSILARLVSLVLTLPSDTLLFSFTLEKSNGGCKVRFLDLVTGPDSVSSQL